MWIYRIEKKSCELLYKVDQLRSEKSPNLDKKVEAVLQEFPELNKENLKEDLKKILSAENIPRVEFIATWTTKENAFMKPVKIDERDNEIAISLLRLLAPYKTEIDLMPGKICLVEPGDDTKIAESIRNYMDKNHLQYDREWSGKSIHNFVLFARDTIYEYDGGCVYGKAEKLVGYLV